MTAPFVPAREQDASPTIRGFVYQANVTILRWLELPEGAVLELERGEDIDIVRRVLVTTSSTDPLAVVESRILEQTKHLKKNLTLRSDAAVKGVLDFQAHRAANPELDLRYRFTTNAGVGFERPAAISGCRVPAITLWEGLRTRTLPAKITPADALSGVHAILKSAGKPEDVAAPTWKAFRGFLKKKADLLQLVERFEWGMGARDHWETSLHVRQRLRELGLAHSDADADERHQRLLVRVLSVLAEDGEKRLAKAGLADALSSELSAAGQQLLAALTPRILALEESLHTHGQSIQLLTEQLRLVSGAAQADVQLTNAATLVRLTAPPLITHGARRQPTVETIVSHLATRTWLALDGSASSGKSELALLVASAMGGAAGWVSFRGYDEALSSVRLKEALRTFSERGVDVTLRSRTLVLDDLPDLSTGDLGERILGVAALCADVGAKLITTCGRPPSVTLKERAEVCGLLSERAPPFSEADTAELLSNFGMPGSWTENYIRFINQTTSGHPALVMALSRHLQSVGWQSDDEFIRALVHESFAADLNDDTLRRVASTVGPEARDLLFRLREVIGDLSIDDVVAIASVDAAITRPRERLVELLGLWVQRTATETYVVSPLVRRLSGNLGANTSRVVNAELARIMLSEKALNQGQLLAVITHLFRAEQWDRAGLLIAKAYIEAPRDLNLGRILFGGYVGALPERISAAIRLFIRALQLRRSPSDAQRQLLLDDIDALERVVPDAEGWAVVGVVANAGLVLTAHRFELALRVAMRGGRLAAEKREGSGREWAQIERFGSLVFAPLPGASSTADAMRYLDAWEALPQAARDAAQADDVMAARSFEQLGRLPYTSRLAKPLTPSEWLPAVAELEALRLRAKALDLRWLGVFVDATATIVLAEGTKQLAEALALSTAALADESLNDEQRFVLEACIGRQHLFAADDTAAVEWLTRALARSSRLFPDERVVAALSLARAHSRHDFHAAAGAAQQAAAAATLAPVNGTLLQLKALGELAIALSNANDQQGAFGTLEDAALLQLDDQPASKERLFRERLLSQVMFLVWQRVRGLAPQMTPHQGFMMNTLTEVAEKDLATVDAVAPFVLLSSIAETLGHDERASEWATRAMRVTETRPDLVVLSTVGPTAVAACLHKARFDEALDAALRGAAAVVAADKLAEQQLLKTQRYRSADDVLGPGGEGPWKLVEDLASRLFFVPSVLALGTLWSHDRNAADRAMRSLAGLCRQQGQAVSDVWDQAASLIDAAAETPPNIKEVNRIANGAGSGSLRCFGYILATLNDQISVRSAQQAHRIVLSFCRTYLSKDSAHLNRTIALPFFENYWMHRFRTRRAEFLAPMVVDSALNAALALPSQERAAAVLDAVLG